MSRFISDAELRAMSDRDIWDTALRIADSPRQWKVWRDRLWEARAKARAAA